MRASRARKASTRLNVPSLTVPRASLALATMVSTLSPACLRRLSMIRCAARLVVITLLLSDAVFNQVLPAKCHCCPNRCQSAASAWQLDGHWR
jgi:hypothetical protein